MQHTKNKQLIYIGLTAIFILAAIYHTGRQNHVEFQNVSFSYETADNWTDTEFNDSNWKKTGVTYLSTNAGSEVYLRQFFETGGDSISAYMIADDCISEIYINGQNVFEGNCTSCTHCKGEEFAIKPTKEGKNLLAVKVINFGGPSTLKIRLIQRGTLFYITLALVIASFFLIYIRKLRETNILTTNLIVLSILIYAISMLGYIDLYSSATLIVTSCILFLLLAKEQTIEKKSTMIIFFLILASGFLLPIFKNIDYWGRGDWDAFYGLTYVPLKTLFEYHQLPLWNPYICGGVSLIGDPEVAFYSPQTLITLLFGLTAGIRINILLHLAIALFGMWLLTGNFGLKGYARLFPSFVYSLSSLYFKHMWEGHYTYLAIAWIPFVFHYYIEGLKDTKKLLLAGVSMSLILFSGNINYLGYSILLIGAYSILETIARRENLTNISGVKHKLKPILAVIAVLIIFTLFSAIKIIPMIEHYRYSPRIISDYAFASPTYDTILKLLTDYNITETWHESSAYIGTLALLVILLGVILSLRTNTLLIILCLFFFMILLNKNSPIQLWTTINANLPLYDSIRVVARTIIMVLLTASILGGIALKTLNIMSKRIPKAIVIAVLINLFLVTPYALDDWFSVEPHTLEPANYNTSKFQQISYSFEDGAHASSDMYKFALVNKGVINCWSPIAPNIRATPKDSQQYRGESYVTDGSGTAEIVYYTPNKIKIKVNASAEATLVLNQNYYPGWQTTTGQIKSYNRLISTKINQNTKEIEFYYQPTSFVIGALISGLTLIFTVYVFVKLKKKRIANSK